jgi:uncharacterized membrane protein YdjX (TVP38/TMEM64 family)
VRSLGASLLVLRARVDELGPLRWVVLASALLPTAGLIVLLANLPQLAATWPHGALGAAAAVLGIAALTGAMLLPPSVAALAAGYVFGTAPGAAIACVAIGAGGTLGLALWPLAGSGLYAFMRDRPRALAVQQFCAGGALRGVAGVLLLRGAAKVPFAVITLLLSVVRVPPARVWLGSTLGALPLAWVAGGLGSAWRAWREHGASPSALELASLALGAAFAALTAIVARRGLRGWNAAR